MSIPEFVYLSRGACERLGVPVGKPVRVVAEYGKAKSRVCNCDPIPPDLEHSEHCSVYYYLVDINGEVHRILITDVDSTQISLCA